MKKLLLILLTLLFSVETHSGILFEANFDSDSDWTVTQPSSSTQYRYPGYNGDSLDLPSGGDWDAIYNGPCQCDNGLSGEPGNNLMYIDEYAGYPDYTNTCYGGSGKCLTFFDESCLSYFDDSDGNLATYLDSEQQELYIRWRVRFNSSMEIVSGVNFQMKMYHFQYHTDGQNPFSYGSNDPNKYNRPNSIGGLYEFNNTLYFYAVARCVDDYLYCDGGEQIIYWTLGATSGQRTDGILDGDWHSLELRIKLNTIVDTANGIMELWFDGTKKDYLNGYEGNALLFNDSETEGLRGLDVIVFGGNDYNQWDASPSTIDDAEQWTYSMDSPVVSTEYIGPDYVVGGSSVGNTVIGSGTVNQISPSAPTIQIIE